MNYYICICMIFLLLFSIFFYIPTYMFLCFSTYFSYNPDPSYSRILFHRLQYVKKSIFVSQFSSKMYMAHLLWILNNIACVLLLFYHFRYYIILTTVPWLWDCMWRGDEMVRYTGKVREWEGRMHIAHAILKNLK